MAKYNLSKVTALFRKFGGFRLFRGYAKVGFLGTVCKECLIGVLKRKPADEVYSTYQRKIVLALQNQYRSLMKERLAEYERSDLPHQKSNVIWFCWLQGIEDASPMIHICLESLRQNFPNKIITVVDDYNRHQFVTLPDHIEKRWKKKQIPPALFADLLRLELLIEQGGTWIDSTVLCTGEAIYGLPLKAYLDADLFFFQFRKQEASRYAGISNWFITSSQNNPLLMTLRDMLYAYWEDYDCVLEYFVFHRLFDMIAAVRPEILSKMPYAYSPNSLALGHNWWREYKKEKFDKLVSEVSFHKLTYKVEDNVVKDKNNYYNYIIRHYAVER